MKSLSKFYFTQTKEIFFKSVLAVILINLLRGVLLYLYDDSWFTFNNGSRLPILVVSICSIVILWSLNRMDTSDETRTPASFFKAEESQKMLVRFLVSYAEIAILVILEGVFMIIYHNMVIDLVRIFLFFPLLACYCIAFVSYFILLKQFIKNSNSTNQVLTICYYSSALFFVFIGNGFSRRYFSSIDSLLFFTDIHFYLSSFLFNVSICSGIIWLYLQKNNKLNNRG